MKVEKYKTEMDWDMRRRILMGVYDCMVAFRGRPMEDLKQLLDLGNYEPIGLKSKRIGRRFNCTYEVNARDCLRWLASGAKCNKIEWVS